MCGCGGAEAVNQPESGDLVAIIHPKSSHNASTSPTKSGSSSELSSTSCSRRSSSSSESSNTSQLSLSRNEDRPYFNSGRLYISNRSKTGNTVSELTFAIGDDNGHSVNSHFQTTSKSLQLRIHRFGFPTDIESIPNPVVHCFPMLLSTEDADENESTYHGIKLRGPNHTRLDLGADGILGRTVSLYNYDGRIIGEGVLGRT